MPYELCWSAEEFIEEFDRRCRRRLGRRAARWDAESTWRPPHGNAHVRADLHRRAYDAGRVAWRAEVEALASLGRAVPAAVVRHVWAMHEQRLRHARITADELRLEHLDALRHLFDFATAPAAFAPTGGEEFAQPPGLSVDQRLFSSDPRTLDDFATAIAGGTARAGLYCLAGLSGSGRTTALRRIEWFARHLPPHPVVHRCEVGASLDGAAFTNRLASGVCRSVMDHCHGRPRSQPLRPNFVLFALGHLGSFCRRTLLGVLALIVALAAWCAYYVLATNAALPGWAWAVGGILGSSLFLGSCALLSDRIKPAMPAWPALLLVAFWPAAALLCQLAGYAPFQVVHRAAGGVVFNPFSLVGFWFAGITCVGLAILFLPDWWPAYARAASLRRRGRVGGEDFQGLLAECGRAFGGVVLLIDEADQLPIEGLQELLRLLRPVAKSPSVRTVVAVPRYVHAAIRNGTLSDPHVVVDECLLVGERYAPAGGDGAFAPSPRARRDFDEFLRDLLVSRLRIPLADSLSADDAPLSLALSPWMHAPEAARDETLRNVHRTCPTRRDVIRECEAVLADPARRPFPARPDRDLAAERDLLQRVRAEYPRQDRALPVEIVQRVTGTDTQIRLVAPPSDLPPARPLGAMPDLDLPAYYLAPHPTTPRPT